VSVAYLTFPSSSSLAFVSVSNGVDANTHRPPLLSRIAVERPPTGNSPYRANGLKLRHQPLRLRIVLHGWLIPREDPDISRYLKNESEVLGKTSKWPRTSRIIVSPIRSNVWYEVA
jgi:hypothetical protein